MVLNRHGSYYWLFHLKAADLEEIPLVLGFLILKMEMRMPMITFCIKSTNINIVFLANRFVVKIKFSIVHVKPFVNCSSP